MIIFVKIILIIILKNNVQYVLPFYYRFHFSPLKESWSSVFATQGRLFKISLAYLKVPKFWDDTKLYCYQYQPKIQEKRPNHRVICLKDLFLLSLGFYISPTAKVIQKLGLGLKSSKRLKKFGSNPQPLVY